MNSEELFKQGMKVTIALDSLRKEVELEVIILTNKLYNKMDNINTQELYKAGRYFDWQNDVNKMIDLYGAKEQKLLREAFRDVYIEANPFNNPIDERHITKALEQDWAGRNFSKSVWNDTQLLKVQVKKKLQDNISSGKGIDKLSKELRERFSVNKTRSDVLARTETQYFINQGQKDRYIERGVKRYEYDAELDGKTSDICDDLNGNIFSFGQAKAGVNFPPMHPNCRSTIKPVIED